MYDYLGLVTVCVSSKKIFDVIIQCKAKFSKMMIDLEKVIQTFADDPKNGWP